MSLTICAKEGLQAGQIHFADGGGRSKGWEFGRPFSWETPAAQVATKANGKGCVCKQLDVFRPGDIVIIKEREEDGIGKVEAKGEERMLRRKDACAWVVCEACEKIGKEDSSETVGACVVFNTTWPSEKANVYGRASSAGGCAMTSSA